MAWFKPQGLSRRRRRLALFPWGKEVFVSHSQHMQGLLIAEYAG